MMNPQTRSTAAGPINDRSNIKRPEETLVDNANMPPKSNPRLEFVEEEEEPPRLKRLFGNNIDFCSCCGTSSPQVPVARRRVIFFRRLLNNPLWTTLIVLCSLVSLFGAQVQILATDSRSDYIFDYIYLSVFVVFSFDLAIRIDAEPNYFVFHVGCCSCCLPPEQRQQQQRRKSNRGESSTLFVLCPDWARFQIGSFLFWCEFISTLVLLYNISFISPWAFQQDQINIYLNEYNVPISGLNPQSSFGFSQLALFVIIARTARVARFIRSFFAMTTLSSMVNWYRISQLLNPGWYLTLLKGVICGHRDSAMADSDRADRSSGTPTDGARGSSKSKWAVISNLSASLKQYKQKFVGTENGSVGGCQRFLHCIGLGRRNDESWKRQQAATRIQRAWRSARMRHLSFLEERDASKDFAWNAQSTHLAVSQQRSTLRGNAFSRSKARLSTLRLKANASSEFKKRNESQVGSAMRELTGTRVAVYMIIALILTVMLTYAVSNNTIPATMVVLYTQTANSIFAEQSIQAARTTAIPNLYQYTFRNETVGNYIPVEGGSVDYLRSFEKLQITVYGDSGDTTVGLFSNRVQAEYNAVAGLISTIFIILIWFFGVTSFAGPVMVLVVIPIERMVRLLGMLTLDPLGYQNTPRYRKFVAEEDEITKNTRWTKEILRGMETSFLMLTILRIGSLMKVGFGSAGVEIIRHNLESSKSSHTLLLSEKGWTVSCIFLFCDIRQFTDATECLQEEVFVFTNRIAGVVHSICHSYGGSANKNIGDAFLLSWRLDDESNTPPSQSFGGKKENFAAKNNQADKALLSVVKMCTALYHDDYYIETMSEHAREALLAKLSKRKGPIVQMGFGLHAGMAVQGAIGSQRKIDATYVSEAVEKAEFLESSTKKYGVKMLMSDRFHRLLHPNNRRRCRKIDQIMLKDEGDEEDDESGEMIELLTFDMDIDALWKNSKQPGVAGTVLVTAKSDSLDSASGHERRSHKKQNSGIRQHASAKAKGNRRLSVRVLGSSGAKYDGVGAGVGVDSEPSDGGLVPTSPVTQNTASINSDMDQTENNKPPKLVLPTGPALYNASVWASDDMRRIRQLYSDGIFFQKFSSGLNSYYSKDWEHARQCFVTILERFEDGPSRYFLTQIEKNNGKPPRNFRPYGTE